MLSRMKEIFLDCRLPFKTQGKNVGKNEINIKCPFCNDPSFHMGIHPINGYRCLICDSKGNTRKLIEGMTGKTLPIPDQIFWIDDDKRKQIKPISLQKLGFTKRIPKTAEKYLYEREIDPKIFIEENDLWFSDFFGGKYKYRIIFPIKINNITCGFIGRDYTGRSPIRYKDYSKGFSSKYTLFGADKVEPEKLLIVEGVFDKGKIDHKRKKICGCISHKQISKEQILQAKFFGFRKIFICMDRDMSNDIEYLNVSKTICDTIALLFKVQIILIDEADPGSASIETIQQIRKTVLNL